MYNSLPHQKDYIQGLYTDIVRTKNTKFAFLCLSIKESCHNRNRMITHIRLDQAVDDLHNVIGFYEDISICSQVTMVYRPSLHFLYLASVQNNTYISWNLLVYSS